MRNHLNRLIRGEVCVYIRKTADKSLKILFSM